MREHIPRITSIKGIRSLIDKDDVDAHFNGITAGRYRGFGSTERTYLTPEKKEERKEEVTL